MKDRVSLYFWQPKRRPISGKIFEWISTGWINWWFCL